MKVLVGHNFYKQAGGEDVVFESEVRLLEEHGHHVIRYTMRNDEIDGMGKLSAVKATLWNKAAHEQVTELVRKHRPQIAHFHNTFPLMSPSVYYAARAEGAAVVQTLHNYRLLCPAATFVRDGHVCEDCLGKKPWRAVQHKCYRESRSASAVSATMLMGHRAMGTWSKAVDLFVALTNFAKDKFIAGGLDPSRIEIKPNFVNDLGKGAGLGNYALFVGRLVDEKGIRLLLEAWGKLKDQWELRVVGEGPLGDAVSAAERWGRVKWLGRRSHDEVCQLMRNASVLVFPSTWYEGMPRTIVEAYSAGAPVIASNLGSMAEMIQVGASGALFAPGDPDALAKTITEVLNNPAQLQIMRQGARIEYEQKYQPAENYRLMRRCYENALKRRWETEPRPAEAMEDEVAELS